MEASPGIFANTLLKYPVNMFTRLTYPYLECIGQDVHWKKERSMCISKKLYMMINSDFWSHPGLLRWKKSHCLNVCVHQPITERKSVTEIYICILTPCQATATGVVLWHLVRLQVLCCGLGTPSSQCCIHWHLVRLQVQVGSPSYCAI